MQQLLCHQPQGGLETYVDLVLVIMVTCPHTLLQVLANTNEKSTN